MSRCSKVGYGSNSPFGARLPLPVYRDKLTSWSATCTSRLGHKPTSGIGLSNTAVQTTLSRLLNSSNTVTPALIDEAAFG
jgi:hypothetical protein